MKMTSHLESLKYTRGSLQILDQLKVPYDISYRDVHSVEDAVNVIKNMQVRGGKTRQHFD